MAKTVRSKRVHADKGAPAERRLYLSAIADHFDPSRDLALGPWCFIGREDAVPDWENLPFIDAFEAPGELAAAVRGCAALLAHRLTLLADLLNRRHGTERSFAFWWTLGARWMNHLISAAWRRWVHVGKFAAAHGDMVLTVPIDEDAETRVWDFADTLAFLKQGLLAERFDFWLWSLCALRQKPPRWTMVPVATDARAEIPIPEPPLRSNAFRRFLRRRLGRLPFTDVPGSSAGAIGFLSIALAILPKHGTATFRAEPRSEPPNSFPPEFLVLIDHLVAATMPRSLSDDFAARDAKAATCRYVPGRLYVNGSATVNDDANFQIAHAIEAGERIVRVQHGSDYGTMAHVNIEASSEYMNDAFLSWGWTEQDGRRGNFVPVPAPGMSSIRDRHRQRNDSIILTGTKMILRNYRVDHAPQPAAVVHYRRDKLAFVSSLDGAVRKNLVYRGYGRGATELEDFGFVRRHAPDVGPCKGDLVSAMLGCRLLVLDHPGTTLNEAMAANVPIVCFWEPAAWRLAPEATPYFEALTDARILFGDGGSAARHVNAVAGDVAQWWRFADVQQARKRWADRFARTSSAWWWDWFKVLSKI